MSEIKKELWKLSEKMEIEGKSNTIAGQINIMNRALGGQTGHDIADSIKKYTDVAGEETEVVEYPFKGMVLPKSVSPSDINYGMQVFIPNSDGVAYTDASPANTYIIEPVKELYCTTGIGISCRIYFTPRDDFDGIYGLFFNEEILDYDVIKVTLSGSTITPDDGYIYYFDINENAATTPLNITKTNAKNVLRPFPTNE